MLTLCGFSASNYYNKVKLALLEKGVAFEEELAWVGETDRNASPLGKVPYLKTEHGPISESTVVLEYIEDQFPAQPLLPADAFQKAKVRELLRYIELHLELVARELYPQAFFGGQVSDKLKERIRPQLEKNIAAFGRLAKFSPFIAGEHFSLADCAAAPALFYADWTQPIPASLPLLRAYRARLLARPSFARAVEEARPYRHLFPLGAPQRD